MAGHRLSAVSSGLGSGSTGAGALLVTAIEITADNSLG